MSAARIAIVLPPREGFSPGAVGAIGLLVSRIAARTPGCVVLGQEGRAGFPGIEYRQVPRLLWPPGTNQAYAAGAARLLRRLRPSLVEVHNRPRVALDIARRLPGTPVMLLLNNDPQDMRGTATPAQRQVLLDRLALVVLASGFLRARLLDGVAPPARPPVVLPNYLDLALLPPIPRPEARARRIVFAGRVVADKGADVFVDACARALPLLPGWSAAMIGADRFSATGPETPFLRALRPRAAAAGVAMEGYRPHDQVLQAMAEAAIVAVPSRWPEPFGLAALEALACGAALVTTTQGGLPEVVGDAALTVPPGDAEALAAAFLVLAGDPARRAALGAAGQARARLFDADRAAATLDALRAQVLADRPEWSRAGPRPISGETQAIPE